MSGWFHHLFLKYIFLLQLNDDIIHMNAFYDKPVIVIKRIN